MQPEEKYIFFDVIDKQKTYSDLNIHPNKEYNMYVDKKFYDAQVLCGQETSNKTRHQIDIDVNRSRVEIDGEIVDVFPNFISLEMTRYCTQTCMALPVEILSQNGIVAELSRPYRLRVQIWGNTVHLKKKMRLIPHDYLDKFIPITIILHVDMNESCILLKFKTFDYKSDTDIRNIF